MVFSNFNNYLGFTEKTLPPPSVITISDFKIDGNFVLHHFISYYLKNNGAVSILGLAQTATHYTNAAHKLGINLQIYKEQNLFHVIDGLKFICDSFLETNAGESIHLGNPRDPAFSLKKLWQTMKQSISLTSQPHLFIIDDITALLNMGASVQSLLDLIHYCKVLSTQSNVTFVILCHSDEDDDDYVSLMAGLEQYSSLRVHVNSLKTGYSRDLSGEIHITKYQRSESTSYKLMHFKLLDKDVRFFAPGTSAAVL